MCFQWSRHRMKTDTNSHRCARSRNALHRICKLDWFSTEIALTLEEFVVVDYVNDGIDTRVQSKAVDGVPDEVCMARQVHSLKSTCFTELAKEAAIIRGEYDQATRPRSGDSV